jgi:GDP-fucose transporter C1
MLAFYLWGNKPTALGVISIFVVLGGSLLYTFVKMDENKKPPPAVLKTAPAGAASSSQQDDIEMQKPLRSN